MTNSSTTVVALLDAAEVAFAEHGLEHVSLRSIMREAGANPAAVHYHYGSKDGLAEAVIDRVLGPLQERRTELLEAAVDAAVPDPPSVRALIEALVRPDLEAMAALDRRNPAGVRLIGAIYGRPSAFAKAHVERSFAPVARRFMPHLAAALPHVSAEDVAWRIRWVVFGLLGALLSEEEILLDDAGIDGQLAPIVDALAGALSAPSPRHDR